MTRLDLVCILAFAAIAGALTVVGYTLRGVGYVYERITR